MNNPKVYLIPNFLGQEVSVESSFPSDNVKIINSLSHFAVENLKDSRRFLVRLGLKEKIDQSEFYNLNKRSDHEAIQPILDVLKSGHSVGIISDAGCPGIADPGAILVHAAHQNKIKVVPLIGPSSILLAVMASGFNGQSFAFNGYLNREKPIRAKEIKELENRARSLKQTQVFMETPYRNESLWEDLLQQLNPSTKLCIAANVSLPNEYIRSMTIAAWRKSNKQSLNKIPAIFLISA